MKTTKSGKRMALTAGLILLVLAVSIGITYRAEIRAWYEFRQLFESLGRNAQGCPEYRHRETGIVFVSLPGGKFLMGSLESDEMAFDEEHPQHEVTLSPFLIGKYEIAQGQWRKIMGNLPGANTSQEPSGDVLPVGSAWLSHIEEFCDKTGLSLPTEAQWEYACRAGTTTRYSFGNEEAELAAVAWYHKNSKRRLHPVGQKIANGFGIHDMHGNVFEWCVDVYDAKFYSKPESRQRDARCASGFSYRVLRGGAYYTRSRNCRSAYRGEVDDPGIMGPGRGFRPVWPPRKPDH